MSPAMMYGPHAVNPPPAWDKDKDWVPGHTSQPQDYLNEPPSSATYPLCPRCGLDVRVDRVWFDEKCLHQVCFDLLYGGGAGLEELQKKYPLTLEVVEAAKAYREAKPPDVIAAWTKLLTALDAYETML